MCFKSLEVRAHSERGQRRAGQGRSTEATCTLASSVR